MAVLRYRYQHAATVAGTVLVGILGLSLLDWLIGVRPFEHGYLGGTFHVLAYIAWGGKLFAKFN